MLPSPDILNDMECGKFVLSNLAAKRAKQLGEGAPPLVSIESNHPLTIALAEIAAGKIKPILPALTETVVPDIAATMLSDGSVPAELGMLLPALDETEVALVVSLDEEHDIEEHEEGELSISDLIGEEEEVVAPAGDEETLSLSDIAEQENTDEDEEQAEQ